MLYYVQYSMLLSQVGEYFTATLLQLLFTLSVLVITMIIIMPVYLYVIYYSVCSIAYCVNAFFVSL